MASSHKQTLFGEILPALGREAAYFPLACIKAAVAARQLGTGAPTLKVYLNEALRKGLLHDAGRGWYSRLSEQVTLDSKPVAKLIRAVEKAFPLLDFSVWSTVQLNPWMHHLLAHPVHFLNAPADTLESVGDRLRAEGWEVAVNPPESKAAKAVQPGERMVVLRPILGRQPSPVGRQAAIEHILVDLIAECRPLALMDHPEAEGVVASILGQHLVQIAAMTRYAASRKNTIPALDAVIQRHQTGLSDDS